jgi:hypothetical protein
MAVDALTRELGDQALAEKLIAALDKEDITIQRRPNASRELRELIRKMKEEAKQKRRSRSGNTA